MIKSEPNGRGGSNTLFSKYKGRVASIYNCFKIALEMIVKHPRFAYEPFLGYSLLRAIYLASQKLGLAHFRWEVTYPEIEIIISKERGSRKYETVMVKEGHVGGYIHGGAPGTFNPILWTCLIDFLDVKSILDIGCGRGFSTKFFAEKVPVVVGVEGSLQAIETSLVPDKVVCHDYTKGLSPVTGLYDLCWCCEVVEHIEEDFILSVIEDFKKCRYVAMTYAIPGQGGYHHVNEQFQVYWTNLLLKQGFIVCKRLTNIFRNIAVLDEIRNGTYNHFAHKGLFLINTSLVPWRDARAQSPKVTPKKTLDERRW